MRPLTIVFPKPTKEEELLAHYQKKLNEHLTEFYSKLVEDDTYGNEEVYIDYNKRWKEYARKANTSQKMIAVDIKAFEKQIELFKKQAAINSYESLKLDSEELKSNNNE